MKNTKNYFENRNKGLKGDLSRGNLALREINTIKILEKLSEGSFMNVGNSVVDIGCGDKFLESAFKKEGLNYHGYDIDDLDIEFDNLPHDKDSIDLIISYAVIEHLSDPQNMLDEALRCLKPGGSIVIRTQNWQYSYKDFFNDYTHVKPYSPIALRSLLSNNGYEKIYDFPNLRCKSKFAYSNKYRYVLANARPFTETSKFSFLIPSFLKGKAKGMFIVAKKPI